MIAEWSVGPNETYEQLIIEAGHDAELFMGQIPREKYTVIVHYCRPAPNAIQDKLIGAWTGEAQILWLDVGQSSQSTTTTTQEDTL